MPTQQEQIDWLIRQVNSLKDAECGCQECEEAGIPMPEMQVRYGKAYKDSLGLGNSLAENTVRKYNFVGQDGKAYSGKTNMLIVDIQNWDDIKDYSPTILLDRYRHKEWIGKNTTGGNSFRKSGYRHEELKTAELNNRVNEVALTGPRTVVDFIPENYFRVFAGEVWGKGMAKDKSTSKEIGLNSQYGGVVKISLRIRLTVEDKVIETNQLLQLRMVARMNTLGSPVSVTFDYTHI